MRRAIYTDNDYRQWFGEGDENIYGNHTTLFNVQSTKYAKANLRFDWDEDDETPVKNKLHTTNPMIHYVDKMTYDNNLNPKVQIKDSTEMNEIWANLGRYMSENEIKTCADWMHYISDISSGCYHESIRPSSSYTKDYVAIAKAVDPNERITIYVDSNLDDFDGQYSLFQRSLLSFIVLHNDGSNVVLAPLLRGTEKTPFENNVEEVNYPHAEDVFVTKLCSAKTKKFYWANELFVVNIDSISGQPENSRGGLEFDDELKFGDFIHATWKMKESINTVLIGDAILGDNLVYDLIPQSDLYVGGNLIEKMLRLTNDNYNMFAMLDLMNELTHQCERVIDTHTVSTTTKVKTSKTTFIPTWKDNRPKQIVDLTDGEYVMYSDVFRCPVCNVKVKVICKGSNRKSQAECPLCKKGKIEFPHLVNEEGVEEE